MFHSSPKAFALNCKCTVFFVWTMLPFQLSSGNQFIIEIGLFVRSRLHASLNHRVVAEVSSPIQG